MGICKSSIEDLVENNDIELFTPIEYIVGHICKNISSTDINSGEKSPKIELFIILEMSKWKRV